MLRRLSFQRWVGFKGEMEFFLGDWVNDVQVTNQDWYARRGYRLITTMPDYYHTPDREGNIRGVRAVFMRKDVV